jgi:hypothetical protein
MLQLIVFMRYFMHKLNSTSQVLATGTIVAMHVINLIS